MCTNYLLFAQTLSGLIQATVTYRQVVEQGGEGERGRGGEAK